MMKLIQVFTFIAVFIGCLSLYGLVSFMAAQKRREVAVRKVLGAKIESIVFLFLKEFGRLMLIAFALSAPLGWWGMNKWSLKVAMADPAKALRSE
jgi:putative ABC transport system permease protein